MRKTVVLVLAAVMAMSVLLVSGCGAGKVVEEARAALDTYFEEFSDEDADGVLAVLDEELISELGGEQETANRLLSRRGMLGEVKEYSVSNTSFQTNGGVTEVELTVDTEYENGESIEEVYTFLTVGDGLKMTGIDLPREKAADELAEMFFSALDDPEAMMDLYIPSLNNEGLAAELESLSERLAGAGGEYADYTLTGEMYDYRELGQADAVFVYAAGYELEFEGMNFVCEMQMSVENSELGINHASIVPEPAEQICDAYYKAMSEQDSGAALLIYADVFFEATQGGADAWEQQMLIPLSGEYGKFVSYDIDQWDATQTTLPDGSVVDTLSVFVYAEYEGIKVEETLVILNEPGGYEVLGHFIEIAE